MKETHNRFVVYTVMVGGYDNVLQPDVVDSRFDYVLFSDVKETDRIGVWEIWTFDYHNPNKVRESRYPKMHPNELLAEYEASLYIDANVKITGNEIYDRFMELYSQGVEWGGIKTNNSCPYSEGYWVIVNAGMKKHEVFKWCHRLLKEGYPRYSEVYLNNVIYRLHNDNVKTVDSLWWNLFLDTPPRDQLSLPYAMKKTPGLVFQWILPVGESAWSYPSLTVEPHANRKNKRTVTHYAHRCMSVMQNNKKKKLKDCFYELCKIPPYMASFIFGIIELSMLIIYGPAAALRRCGRNYQNR